MSDLSNYCRTPNLILFIAEKAKISELERWQREEKERLSREQQSQYSATSQGATKAACREHTN